MPPRVNEELNARSKSITEADLDTDGILNRKAGNNPSFQLGIAADKGHRRSMEDSHSFVFDFDNVRGQGFFAVFDGHAGKHAAEWCGQHFHEILLKSLRDPRHNSIPEVLNATYHGADEALSKLTNESAGKIHSGCTAVSAFLRVEDQDSKQPFLPSITPPSPEGSSPKGDASPSKSSTSSKIKQAIKSLSNGSRSSSPTPSPSPPPSSQSTVTPTTAVSKPKVIIPPDNLRRVLYCANAGDARGVLCRSGVGLRLTYDHKGTDKQEARRVMDAGGFVMSGRVNGVLAVTRSLGDTSMKEFVVGAPYTTETEIGPDDEFLILACDGLWDIVSDQKAVDYVRDIADPQMAADALLNLALEEHSQDNITIIVIRFIQPAAVPASGMPPAVGEAAAPDAAAIVPATAP